MPNAGLDCIIVGYNDINFGDYAARQKKLENTSGAYHELKTNSVFTPWAPAHLHGINQSGHGAVTGQEPTTKCL